MLMYNETSLIRTLAIADISLQWTKTNWADIIQTDPLKCGHLSGAAITIKVKSCPEKRNGFRVDLTCEHAFTKSCTRQVAVLV